MELPSGTVTLMFTDIQGSTRLLESLDEEYAAVVRGHHGIVREVLESHGGQELRTYGDAFFVAFAEPGPAVTAAQAIRRKLADHTWPEGHEVRVRIGLHTGEPKIMDGDYLGIDVHRAARICSAGHGGQILLSESTASSLATLPEGLSLHDLGEHRLSDLSEPLRIYQLDDQGTGESFPALRALAADLLDGSSTSRDANLFGRESEQDTIEKLLTEARLGSSRTLVITGEPGIGKTALLNLARNSGISHGMTVLSARGIESEAEVPFGGLLELLGPLLNRLDQLPAIQADALRGAFALGPTVESDRFLIGAATLNLISAHSDRGPILALVDDAQWVDDASLAAVLFAAKRLLVDPVAILFGSRTDESAALESARLPELALTGVDAEAAGRIIARHAPGRASPETIERLEAAAAGNPLVLTEIAADASRFEAAPFGGPLEIETSVGRAYLGRIATMPEPTRKVLALAAAEDSGDLSLVDAAATKLELELNDIEPAEREGLLEINFGRLSWRHPLARSAAYQSTTPAERRAMHAALAEVLPENEEDRRAWHRAAAVLGVDEEVAAVLESASHRARSRSGYSAAATAAERAAGLSPDDGPKARRLFIAAESAWLGGQQERSLTRLREATLLSPEPHLRAKILHLWGQASIRAGNIDAGHDLLLEGAELIEDLDSAQAVVMFAEVTDAAMYAGRPDAMIGPARRAFKLITSESGDRERFFANVALGTALVYGDQGPEGTGYLREAVEILESSESLSSDPRSLSAAVVGRLWLRDGESESPLVDRVIEVARGQGALGALPFALALSARDAATTDRWAVGRSLYEEAIELARETDQKMPLGGALAGLAVIKARIGEPEGCRANAEEALALGSEHGFGFFRVWALDALAELELAGGRPEQATARLEEKQRTLDEFGVGDPDVSPVPELIEVGLRTGITDGLAERLETFAVAAEAKGQPWALARLARSRALLGVTADPDSEFERALRLNQATPDSFETARTRLCYGEHLRRSGQRIRAREQLREATVIFEDLGAKPWSERARTELLATGERARRRDPSTLDDLTPREVQVGLALAGGSTTREAAAKLFLSPKTVEYHLRNTYRKLGINSRAELTEALSKLEPAQPGSSTD